MLPAGIKKLFIDFLISQFNYDVSINNTKYVSGGSINNAVLVNTTAGSYFIKWNNSSSFPEMFKKEAKGLLLLKNTNIIKVPNIIFYSEVDNFSFLVLEYIDSSIKINDFWNDFGVSLARLHKNTNTQFGLDHDNYMGSIYQSNKFHDNWNNFFINERINPLLEKCRNSGIINKSILNKFDNFFNKLDEIFPNEKPSLLHGDLWSGNYIVSSDGKACLIDPAVYYGNREIDISMTKLFGSFDNDFYNAYNQEFNLEKNWESRVDYYNLYPLLIHVLLFGGGYLSSILNIIRKF